MVSVFHPREIGVVLVGEALGGTGKDVEVVGGVAGGTDDGVIPFGDEDGTVVFDFDQGINGVAGLLHG